VEEIRMEVSDFVNQIGKNINGLGMFKKRGLGVQDSEHLLGNSVSRKTQN
jgi:hypothetical protein